MKEEGNNEQLPEGWKWVRLGDVCKKIGDIDHKMPKQETTGYPYVSTKDFTDDLKISFENAKYVSEEDYLNLSRKIKPERGDIIFPRYGTIGKNILIDFDKEFLVSYSCAVIKPDRDLVLSKYVYLYSLSPKIWEEIRKYIVETTQANVGISSIKRFEFPLPNIETQQAIVSKIEELFSELDKGIENLRTAQQQLKTYRQSVLKWAFEGRLTNENVKDGELPEGWKRVKISEISKVVRGGSPRPAGDLRYYQGNIPFLKVADVTNNVGMFLTTFQYTIKEAGLHKTRQIKPNTLLLSNSGATLGIPKICMIDATINDGIAAFLDLDQRSNQYLYYFWESKTRELRNINMGAAQPNLNTDLIKDYNLPYCSFEEQHKIVEGIESRLSVADKMEESINESLQQAEALRQSILKKAFVGKLI
ncbi:restriction endonuclease subunit S [Pinibacter soli]|uniref:Restriction endonuclease subunit S n=1 Tax=Pinibacter soli TaxID=3044211 RepID=A0ABT6RJJ6_9BACT|nr:restriction endonuclease subunit S [Pinibacter soli]MDI3322007.1 restriction endonuclease subunit S [Pinibacter soli]